MVVGVGTRRSDVAVFSFEREIHIPFNNKYMDSETKASERRVGVGMRKIKWK